jgi:hypothetical protein
MQKAPKQRSDGRRSNAPLTHEFVKLVESKIKSGSAPKNIAIDMNIPLQTVYYVCRQLGISAKEYRYQHRINKEILNGHG